MFHDLELNLVYIFFSIFNEAINNEITKKIMNDPNQLLMLFVNRKIDVQPFPSITISVYFILFCVILYFNIGTHLVVYFYHL